MPKPLEPGDELHCPHCRRWHPVKHLHAKGTDYTVRMLYFECRAGQYYAGQIGTPSRHQTRRGFVTAALPGWLTGLGYATLITANRTPGLI